MGARPLPQPDALTGVIAALPAEARTARRLERLGCQVVTCGVGAEHAQAAATKLVASGAKRLLVWGTAGALRANLQPGAVILADRVLDGHGACYPVSADWHAYLLAAMENAADTNIGSLLTVAQPVPGYAGKEALAHTTSAIAVDMEAAAVAWVATENNVPFAALRVIVDPLQQALPQVVQRARATRYMAAEVALRLLARPGDLPAVMALGRNMHVARRSLAAVARHLSTMGD